MKRAAATLALLAACLGAATGQPTADGGPDAGGNGVATLAEWGFDSAGAAAAWQPNAHVRECTVSNGILTCRADGADPIFDLRAPLAIEASPWQTVEVRIAADAEGTAQLFWSGTTDGPHGGLAEAKSNRFPVRGGGDWQTCTVWPFWQGEGRIVRLRLDLYDGARFRIDAIRVRALAAGAPSDRAAFDFAAGADGWRDTSAARPPWDGGALRLAPADDGGFLLAPPLRLDAERHTVASLRLAARAPASVSVLFATAGTAGLARHTFTVQASDAPRVYNVDLLDAENWHGDVVALGLAVAPGSPDDVRVHSLALGPAPAGPAQLAIVHAGVSDTLPRADRPFAVGVRLANTGGTTATGLVATLTAPDGLAVVARPTAHAALRPGAEHELEWQLRAERPLAGELRIDIAAANAPAERATVALRVTPPPRGVRAGYVPEPRPVRGRAEVGAYYFPGWAHAGQWAPIREFPERRPALGWYREGDPEVADWHIKWAVEHGITFFAYDWYWSQGQRQLEHALHDGFLRARYRHLLKFCLLWANHNPPNTSSAEDCLAVTRYWIENYFRRPEHLSLDGKPALIVFSPDRLTHDLGHANVAGVFASMRAACRAAGLAGLYLLACIPPDAGAARLAAEEGYDAVTTYNWAGLGMTGPGNRAPFASLAEGYRRQWAQLAERSELPLLVPVSGGWDSRPWHGERQLVRHGRTPERFRRHVADALAFAAGRADAGPLRGMLLIEAWNEWGEGSYIEPHAEYGFGYLDAIRAVVAPDAPPHEDVVPADVGLGPYDVAAEARNGLPRWEFDAGLDGWDRTMAMADVGVRNGILSATTTGADPAFFGPALRLAAADVSRVTLRLRLTATAPGAGGGDTAQLFWRTGARGDCEAASLRFAVALDGEWHDYALPIAGQPRWRGRIAGLRLDPCSRPGVRVELERIALEPADR